MTISNNSLPRGLAAFLALILGSSVVQAKEVWLEAKAVLPTAATGALAGIPMWGYADCGTSFAGCAAAPATSPGPVITVPVGEGLTMHLRNSLPDNQATSILLVGQRNAPLLTSAPGVIVRREALTTEVLAGLDGDYIWSATNLRPGTYLYQSGSHVQLQVHMGLYGAAVHDAPCTTGTPPCAYPSVPYGTSRILLFSEVDPALHSPATPVNATVGGYAPSILLLNGEPLENSVLPPVTAADGERILLRLINAGLKNHAPQLLGGYFDVVAEDGYPAPVTRRQTATLLAAAKTVDVLFAPTAGGGFPLFDRMARIGDGGGGGPPLNQNPVAVPDFFYILANNNPGGTVTFPSPGVLGNDTDPQGDALRVAPGSVIPTIPPLATLSVDTGTGLTKGRVIFHAPSTTWVGDAYFSYVAREAVTVVPLDSAPAVSHVVHDQHLTTLVFHNPTGTTLDHWELVGEVRGLPVATTLTLSIVQNANNTNCPAASLGVIGPPVTIPASATPSTWTYNGLDPNRAGCNRIRSEVAVPEANGVPAHTATLDANFSRTTLP